MPDPPFLHAEIDEARRVIAQEKEALDQLDLEIEAMKNGLAQLAKKRDQVQMSYTAHYWHMSSIRRVPEDILVEIFLSCLPQDKFVNMDLSNPPLSISQVCRSWREVALSTTKLWASISASVTSTNSYSLANVIKVWLSRSGDRPISLCWDCSELTIVSVSPSIVAMLSFVKRWRIVSINFPDRQGIFLPRITHDDAPMLEEMRLQFHGNPASWAEMDDFLHLLTRSPQLCKIDLACIMYPNISKTFIPWHQFTHLTLSDSSLGTKLAIEIMRRCPNLVSCKFIYDIGKSNDTLNPPIGPRIILPHLRTLTLHTWSEVEDTFYDYFVLPSLQHLKFCYVPDAWDTEDPDNDNPYWPCHEFTSLCSRSSFSLLSLEIVNAEIDVQLLLHLLSQSPDLVRLSICNNRENAFPAQMLLQSMIDLSDNSVLIPKLEDLELQGNIEYPDIFPSLAYTVERRRKMDAETHSQLKRVLIGYANFEGPEEEDRRRLLELVKKGLDLVWISQDEGSV